jgi:ectoine hydroxylase-related dioxygenase (phytanoyl-CoA dioxygenase family)
MCPATCSTCIGPGVKLDAAVQQEAIKQFHRDGYAMIPDALSADEAGELRELADRFMDDPATSRDYVNIAVTAAVLRCTQALHRAYADLLVREPFLGLAEAILGPNVGFCGQNVIRTGKGTGVTLWHVDDILEFPLPPDVPRHDARVQMPVFWLSIQIALSDIDDPEIGPTEIVPGSHYSGRKPPENEADLVFDGRGVKQVLCKAGDAYLFNHQTWHRGAPNRSDKRRYLMQNQYCRAWGPYRFNSSDAVKRLPPDQMEDACPRLKKLLEVHRMSGW